MISRRNIRVKVMQSLYTLETLEGGDIKPGEPKRILQKHFDLTQQLATYLVHCLLQVARYAETDARQKASKHLPTAEDLNVNTKIAGNELVWKILEQESYIKAVEAYKPIHKEDTEITRKIYLTLLETPEYKEYVNTSGRTPQAEKKMLEFIFTTLMLPNEDFTNYTEDNFTNWDDDCEMMELLVMHYLQKPGSLNFLSLISRDKLKFAEDLLEAVQNRKEVTMDLIKPRLKNWDPERIAILDMVLMQMGVCEFLYFETIPPKVTINEYIDLAKAYSTPQSGQFVNGILDNIHKDLVRENKMLKTDFKKGS